MEKVEVNSKRWLSLEDFEGEVWKDIPQSFCSVSNMGRIRSNTHTIQVHNHSVYETRTFYGRILKTRINQDGYYIVSLYINKKRIKIGVARLVAQAFIDNPNGLPQVNHKNEDKSDNRCINLEWCTQLYNINYGTGNIRKGISLRRNIREKCHKIKQYSKDGILLKTFVGSYELNKEGFDNSAVYACCMHKLNQCYGYVWRFDNDPFTPPPKRGRGIKTKIEQLDLNGNLIAVYENMHQAAIAVVGKAQSYSTIRQCCIGNYSKAFGYKWRIKDE